MTQTAKILALAPLLLGMHSGCVSSPMNTICSIEGVKTLPDSSSQQQICAAFQNRLEKRLGEQGAAENFAEVRVALAVEPRGNVHALVSAQGADGKKEYPRISLSVMDKPLALSDIELLADNVASHMTAQN